jgi:hypothetical protein
MAAAFAAAGHVKMLAFNRLVAEDWNTKRKAAGVERRATAQTFHSFAYRVYAERHGGVQPANPNNKAELVFDGIRLDCERDFLVDLIEAMQEEGFGLSVSISSESLRTVIKRRPNLRLPFVGSETEHEFYTRLDALLERAPKLFKQWNSLNSTGVTFSDTLYAPAAEGLFKRSFDLVLCDEAQDTNAIRRLIVGRIVKESGQLVFCGDRHQAVYAFNGADSDSIDRIVGEYGTQTLRLSTSYRCAHAIVAEARKIVPHITTHPSNPSGTVVREDFGAFLRRRDLNANDAILCRNNAPLVNTALFLMRNQISCRVLGTEIGSKLQGFVASFQATSLQTLRREVCRHLELAAEIGFDGGSVDRGLSVIALIDSIPGGTVSDLGQLIDRLFRPEGPVIGPVLSTIHKAKGREWRRVFLIGNEKYLDLDQRGPADSIRHQEKNLLYVGITRACDCLSFVTAPETEFKV